MQRSKANQGNQTWVGTRAATNGAHPSETGSLKPSKRVQRKQPESTSKRGQPASRKGSTCRPPSIFVNHHRHRVDQEATVASHQGNGLTRPLGAGSWGAVFATRGRPGWSRRRFPQDGRGAGDGQVGPLFHNVIQLNNLPRIRRSLPERRGPLASAQRYSSHQCSDWQQWSRSKANQGNQTWVGTRAASQWGSPHQRPVASLKPDAKRVQRKQPESTSNDPQGRGDGALKGATCFEEGQHVQATEHLCSALQRHSMFHSSHRCIEGMASRRPGR